MDDLGIVYLIENAQQFWSELEDILHVPIDPTLSRLDATLRQFVSFTAAYHEQFLQSPLQLAHACDLLLASELFAFHSERMCELLVEDTENSTDPHCQLMLYQILLAYGRKNPIFLRSHKRWQPLFPLLMDNVRLEVDPDVDDTFIGGSNSSGSVGIHKGVIVPIEAKLRSLSIRLLYEVCRVQRLSLQDLERIFDDAFIEYLFELVEQTRGQHDDTFNYSVIKLIVALNEQFMVAALQPNTPLPDAKFHVNPPGTKLPEVENRVLRVLMSRLGSSMTFGENMIFMLNRANGTPEDLVMQLLVLKILYLLFTTKGTSEYFYTNDLCVLVDVFLREIVNLDESEESLRHTYLRVLHPLLTKTQLRAMPYKRPQIVRVLESLMANEGIRDIDPTTKRLVQRCLSGEWCVQFRNPELARERDLERRVDSPGIDSISVTSAPEATGRSESMLMPLPQREGSSGKSKSLKTSRSVDNFKSNLHPKNRDEPPAKMHQGSNDSSTSLPHIATAATPSTSLAPGNARRRDRAGSVEVEASSSSHDRQHHTHERRHHSHRPHHRHQHILDDSTSFTQEPLSTLGPTVDSIISPPDIRVTSPTSPARSIPSPSPLVSQTPSTIVQRRMAPPPPKRRKPPAIPAARRPLGSGDSDTTFTTIASSSSQPALSTLAAAGRSS